MKRIDVFILYALPLPQFECIEIMQGILPV